MLADTFESVLTSRNEETNNGRDGLVRKWSWSSRWCSGKSSRYANTGSGGTVLMSDIILVRMVADPTKAVEKQHGYRNALHGVYKMVQQEGPSSLARGLLPNTVCPPHLLWADDQIRAVLMNASQLVSYDFFKDTLLQNGLSNGMPLHILSSALSGTVATTICAPADVVKSRVMNASGNEGPVKLIMESLKKEGPRFLFKGWLPAWSESTSFAHHTKRG